MKALIAEDDPVSLRMLSGLLTSWGHQVVAATNGDDAWRIFQEDASPYLAILDWSMPGLDGLAICERLRRRQTLTPSYVILLTGRTAKGDLVAGLAAGANDYVTKPFDPGELKARVQVGCTVLDLQANVARRMREFEEYVEDAPLGIFVVEQDGSIGFANSRAYTIFGYPQGELLGQPIEILVPECHRRRHVELRDGYVRNPQKRMMASRTELFGQRHDGGTFPLAIGLNPIGRESAARTACTVLDLTELRTAESHLQRFFDISLDMFVIARVDGTFIRVNSNYSRFLGYSPEYVLSRPFTDFIHPDDVAAVHAEVQRLSEGKLVTEFRCRLQNHDGNDHWIEWNVQSVPEDGTIYAVGRNITDRIRLDNQLLYLRRKETAILNNTPSLIYIKDTEGRYEFVNRRHAELFSGNQRTAVGKRARDFHPEEHAERIEQTDRRIVETGETITLEEIARHEDGDHTYISVKFPLFDSDDKVCATVGISTDITEQLYNRQVAHELELARSFQSKLYPKASPAILGLEMAGLADPLTELCGDYFDYNKLGTERLLVSIGDVSGHGVGPALEMTEVRCITRVLARLGATLPQMMRDLNVMVCEDFPESSFISFFLADVDVANRRISYLGAGHDAFLIGADGAVRCLDATHFLLGIDHAVDFREVATADVAQGDVLLLFTDGLNEAMSVAEQPFGRQRTIETVCRHCHKPPRTIIQHIFQAVHEFTSGQPLKDDMTAVVVKVTG